MPHVYALPLRPESRRKALAPASVSKAPERLTLQAATDSALSLAASYIGLMTETPATKPPLPPLFERLKLPKNGRWRIVEHVGSTIALIGAESARASPRKQS